MQYLQNLKENYLYCSNKMSKIICNMKCHKCGFIQEWDSTKNYCPKCGSPYKSKVGSYDIDLE